ncbi:5-formyltetrahydrofolate cyclo-ligase [Maricaulis sp.]|uniref:5-formyltetrahydrofolate cyclo-ligase n=1 Tax=Maricaulis sp. TaxID=1486257 RepID=UPI001B04CCA7|nr:5-formyltetrahydrofolate cyclo-ligase [Maricaulis sp.]MBO6796534.1 5-formyltetrahydrofolate cyclo-ligase [Maricaulis sp.]
MTPSSDRLCESKQVLRQRAGQLRDMAAGNAQRDLAEMTEALGAILRRNDCRVLGGYHPIRSEFDVLPLVDMAWQAGLQTALPVVTSRDQPLEFRRWRVGEPVRQGRFGVAEPLGDAPVIVPDVLLVPGLAFDSHGGRLGYGGGFYDRTIAAFDEQGRTALTIGVCFKEQLFEAVPRETHDRRMDCILFA